MPAARRPAEATLEDVAQAAGVSMATASRALNGSSRTVNPANRERVLAAARTLNYSANLAAQTMAKGATSTLALVVADISDAYFSTITSGVLRAADERALIVTIGITERRPEHEAELVRVLRGQRPQAIVLVGSRPVSQRFSAELVHELTAFQRSGGRVAMVSQSELPFRTVEIQNREGAADLAERLLDLGYRSAAILTGPKDLVTARDRVAGFTEAFAAHGCPVDERWRIPGDFTRDGGFVAAGELQRRGLDQIDVLFAVNDVMAVGAMAYLRSAGLRLPEDLAVAGFDDIPALRDIIPALTTVSLPLEDIGRLAVALALDENADEVTTGRPAQVRIAGSTIIRESTPKIAA